MGLIKAPPVVLDDNIELNQLPNSARNDCDLSFSVTLADGIQVPWECHMKNNNLFVDVPTNLPLYGSKDRYVILPTPTLF